MIEKYENLIQLLVKCSNGDCNDSCERFDQNKIDCEEQLLDEAANVIKNLVKDFRDLRNEFCWNCRRYEHAHMGACDGCRWKDVDW